MTEDFPTFKIRAFCRRHLVRIRQIINNAVKHQLDAFVFKSRAADDRYEFVGDGCLAQTFSPFSPRNLTALFSIKSIAPSYVSAMPMGVTVGTALKVRRSRIEARLLS